MFKESCFAAGKTYMHAQEWPGVLEGWADRGSHTRLLRLTVDLFAKCERSSLW
jgi:hypothetical protein